MASVLSVAHAPREVVLAVRIGENDHQPDRIPELLDLARSLPSPESVDRAVAEVAAIQEEGLGPAVSEVLGIAEDLRRAGLPLEVCGRAAGLEVFHQAGLTALEPREHGFLTETFLDIPAEAPNALPADAPGRSRKSLPIIDVRISTGLDDFMAYLRRNGYSFRVTHVGERAKCHKILAGRRHPYGTRRVHTLFVAPGSDLPAAAALRQDEQAACLHDTQTFQLLAAGDTSGLGPLEDDGVRADLRKEKPTSIEGLASILATHSLPLEWVFTGAVYEEDLMLELSHRLGITLSDAGRLVWSRRRWDGTAEQHRAWFIETAVNRGMPIPDAEERWRSLGDDVKRMRLKSGMFGQAHRCLKAAYLKAHYPEEFGAITAAHEITLLKPSALRL